MHKKYKRVFSINNDLGYRNYTVRDIVELKGKKKLTIFFFNIINLFLKINKF